MKWVVRISFILLISTLMFLAGSCIQKLEEPKVEDVTSSLAEVPLRVPVVKDEGNFSLRSIENVDTNNLTATLVYDLSNSPEVKVGGVLQMKVDPNDPYSYELLKVTGVRTNGNSLVIDVRQASLADILPENSHLTFGDGIVTLTYVENGEEKTAVGPLNLVDVVMVDDRGNKVSIYDEVTNEARRRGLVRGSRGHIIGFSIPINSTLNSSSALSSLVGRIEGGVYGDIVISGGNLDKVEFYLGGKLVYDLCADVGNVWNGMNESQLVVYPAGLVKDTRNKLLEIANQISNDLVNEILSYKDIVSPSEVSNKLDQALYAIRSTVDVINKMSDSDVKFLADLVRYLQLKGFTTFLSNLEGWVSQVGWFANRVVKQVNGRIEYTAEVLRRVGANISEISGLFVTFNPITLEYCQPKFEFTIGGINLHVVIRPKISLRNGIEGSWNVQPNGNIQPRISFRSSSSRSYKVGVGWSNGKGFYGIKEGSVEFRIDEDALRNSAASGTVNMKPYLALKVGIEVNGDLWSGAGWANLDSGGVLKLYDRYVTSLSSGISTGDAFSGISGYLYASLGWSLAWGIFSGNSSWQSPENTLFEKKVLSISFFKAPSILVASKNYTYGVELSWNQVSGASGYYIYRIENGSTNYCGESVSTNFVDMNASFGENYYTVRVYSSTYGWSTYSPIVTGFRSRPAILTINVNGSTNVGLKSVAFVGLTMNMNILASVTNAQISNVCVLVKDINLTTNALHIISSFTVLNSLYVGNLPNIMIEGEIRPLTVEVWAVDNYGVSSLTQSFVVIGGNRDVTPPIVEVTNDVLVLNPCGGSLIVGRANDNLMVKEVWVDDGNGSFRKATITTNYLTNVEWIITNNSISSGYKTVRVYAVDVSNNYSATNTYYFIVPQEVWGIYWRGIYTNVPYSDNIVLIGFNGIDFLFSIDRYPYGSLDTTYSYSINVSNDQYYISDFEYYDYSGEWFYFIFSLGSKLGYVSLHQGQYSFHLSSCQVRNLVVGYDGNVYYSSLPPGWTVTAMDVGRLFIAPGYIALSSFKYGEASAFVGGGITLVVKREGDEMYRVIGHRRGYASSDSEYLYGAYQVAKTNTYSGLYSYFRFGYTGSLSGPDLVVYDAVLFGTSTSDMPVIAFKQGNTLKIGGKYGSTVEFSRHSFRAIKKVDSSYYGSGELCKVVIVTESSDGIWVHFVEGVYWSNGDYVPNIKWSKLLSGFRSYSFDTKWAVDIVPYKVGNDYNYLLIVGQPNGSTTILVKLDSNGNVIW